MVVGIVIFIVAAIAVAGFLVRMPSARKAQGAGPDQLSDGTLRERRTEERRQIERRVRATLVTVERRGADERRVIDRRAEDRAANAPQAPVGDEALAG